MLSDFSFQHWPIQPQETTSAQKVNLPADFVFLNETTFVVSLATFHVLNIETLRKTRRQRQWERHKKKVSVKFKTSKNALSSLRLISKTSRVTSPCWPFGKS